MSPPAISRRTLLAAAALALLLHALAWWFAAPLLRPPSLLQDMATPMYTRTITPEAPSTPAPATTVAQAPAEAAPARPSAQVLNAPSAPSAPKPKPKPAPKPKPKPKPKQTAQAPKPPASTPEPAASRPATTQVASAPTPDTAPDTPQAPPSTQTASAPSPDATPEVTAQTTPGSAPDSPSDNAPATSATAADAAPPGQAPEATPATASNQAPPGSSGPTPAYVNQWPGNTRLRYRLSGHYRGDLHGTAHVLWQREGTRYSTTIALDVGMLFSLKLTSQGHISPNGLRPEIFEEQMRRRLRHVRLYEDSVQLHKGERRPRPAGVQDAASQFVEFSQRLATGRLQPTPGSQITQWLARPGGVDLWTFDVLPPETLHLPRLGPVQTIHLKPQPLPNEKGPISAEIWYAPSLQHLPARILLTQGEEARIDLLLEGIEQE